MYHVYRIWQEVLISHDQPLKNLQIQYKSKTVPKYYSTYSRLLLPILVHVPQSHFNRVHVQNIHVITTSDPHLLYILLPINKLPVQVNTHGTVLDKHLKFSFKTFGNKRK